jgi:group I intron endonuclease
MGYIYKITNTVNNKCYIGVTTQANPNDRWSNHKSHNRQGNGCPFLMKAFKKHGEDAFTFEVLIICFDEDVFRFESEYIKRYNSMSPNGYNVAEGGRTNQSFLGKTHTEETKKILSEKSKAYNANPEVRERARQNAIKFTKTHNIGELQKKSEKWQKALAEGRIGGHAKTEEGKKKISEGLKRYYKSNTKDGSMANRKKISETRRTKYGKKVSQYTKEGQFIASFDSIVEAGEKTNVTRGNVQACVSGRTKTAGGFIWKYEEPKDAPVIEEQNQAGSQ